MTRDFANLYRLSMSGEILAPFGRRNSSAHSGAGFWPEGKSIMGQTVKAQVVGQTILAALTLVLACAPARAGERENLGRAQREHDAVVNGTRLYEVTETVHFGADGFRVTRDALA